MFVTEFVPGDRIQFRGESKPHLVVLPSPDVHTPKDSNGKAVRDTSGKIVTIKRTRSWLETCSDTAMVHLHTDRGIICIHREATAELVNA